MTALLFESYWLAMAGAIAGGALLVAGNNRVNGRLKTFGLGALALGVVLAGMSYLVRTPRERVAQRTRALVAAMVAEDWKSVRALLHPKCVLYLPGGSTEVMGSREEILEAATSAVKAHGLSAARITSLTLAQEVEGSIDAVMSVSSEHSQTSGYAAPTTWSLDWTQTPDGWVVRSITFQSSLPTDVTSRVESFLAGLRRVSPVRPQ